MPDNEHIEAKLAAYVDGELDAAGRAEIEKDLAANPPQRKLVAELVRQRDLVRALPRATSPIDLSDMMGGQMERAALLGDTDSDGNISGGSIHGGSWSQFRAIAAVIVLTAGLAAVVYWVLPSPKAPQPQVVAIVTPENPDSSEASQQAAQQSQTLNSAADEEMLHQQQMRQKQTQPAPVRANQGEQFAASSNMMAKDSVASASPAESSPAMTSSALEANKSVSIEPPPLANSQLPTVNAQSVFVVVRSPDPQAAVERVTQMLTGAQIAYQERSPDTRWADSLAVARKSETSPQQPVASITADAATTQPLPGSAIADRAIASNVAGADSGAQSIEAARGSEARRDPTSRPNNRSEVKASPRASDMPGAGAGGSAAGGSAAGGSAAGSSAAGGGAAGDGDVKSRNGEIVSDAAGVPRSASAATQPNSEKTGEPSAGAAAPPASQPALADVNDELRHQEAIAPPAGPATIEPATNPSAPSILPLGARAARGDYMILVHDVSREQATELGRALAQPGLKQTAEIIDQSMVYGSRDDVSPEAGPRDAGRRDSDGQLSLAPTTRSSTTQPATIQPNPPSPGASTALPVRATTQPANVTTSADRVDLVIVVRDDAAQTLGHAPPAFDAALRDPTAAASTMPSTRSAANSSVAPSTQPANEPTTRP